MFDPLVICRHFIMLHRLAAGLDGKLILAVFGEGLAPSMQHFRPGDLNAMTHAALAYQNVPGANVYTPLAVMRSDLPEGKKGSKDDVIATLGAVVDSDSDHENPAAVSPIPPDYALETSPGNFQYFMLFDKPLAPADAEPLLQALKRAVPNADCANDLCHVWRVAGCLNYPNAGKLKRGRSPEPFMVKVAKPWNLVSRTSVAKLRAVLEPHWEPPPIERTAAPAAVGDLDAVDSAGMVHFLTDEGAFTEYSEWISIGMALKTSFGDDGFKIWQSTFDDKVTPELAQSKWASFKTEPSGNSVTLRTWMQRAHAANWKGQIRKSTNAMFRRYRDAQAAGATLPVGAPGPTGTSVGLPMLGRQQKLTEFGSQALADFIRNSAGHGEPRDPDIPALPAFMSTHGLYEPLCAAIRRIVAMTENGKKVFNFDRASVNEPLAILKLVHPDTYETLRRRFESFGCEVPDVKIKRHAMALSERVEREFMSDDWQRNMRGEIENDNPDNLKIFLDMIGCEVQFNAWDEIIEIRGQSADPEMQWENWTYVDDVVVAKLRTRAMRTGTRFCPGKDFMWESLITLAHRNEVDPALQLLTWMQDGWDKQPRLADWLARALGVPNNPYLEAVGRNIIGGITRRVRRPGVKHDTMVILFGPEGTNKSTLAATLALNATWFSDSVLLGESAKELVLLLAGKTVVEIGEMGMRSSANAATIKAMISRQRDEGRTAYGRAVSKRPRRNIFFGTTNDSEPLASVTGNRRFLPVEVPQMMDLDYVKANIGQLFGEAAALEAAGDDFGIPPEVWDDARQRAEAVRSESDIEIRLTDYLAVTEKTAVAYITAIDLSELCQMVALRSNAQRSETMRALGFRKVRVEFIGNKQSVIWFRGGPDWVPKEIALAARYWVSRDVNGRVSVAAREPLPSPTLVPSQTPAEPLPALPPPPAIVS